jgi:hypothetical protein
VVGTDVSEERIASIFRAGESRREYNEHQIPERVFLHRHRRENLKSYILIGVFTNATGSRLNGKTAVLKTLAGLPSVVILVIIRIKRQNKDPNTDLKISMTGL